MEASMMGEKRGAQGQLFYEFDLEAMVPQDHLLRKIDAMLDLSGLRAELAPITPTPAAPRSTRS